MEERGSFLFPRPVSPHSLLLVRSPKEREDERKTRETKTRGREDQICSWKPAAASLPDYTVCSVRMYFRHLQPRGELKRAVVGEGRKGGKKISFNEVIQSLQLEKPEESYFGVSSLCFIVKSCFDLALHLGVGKRNPSVSSIFKALVCWVCSWPSAGLCRLLHSSPGYFNEQLLSIAWRVGLQSYSGIINVWGSSCCHVQGRGGCCWTWVGRDLPLCQPSKIAGHSSCAPPLILCCHSEDR